MKYVEYSRPIKLEDYSEENWWLPDWFRECPDIKAIQHYLHEKWKIPNEHLGTFRIYISDEDAIIIRLRYGVVFENSDK